MWQSKSSVECSANASPESYKLVKISEMLRTIESNRIESKCLLSVRVLYTSVHINMYIYRMYYRVEYISAFQSSRVESIPAAPHRTASHRIE